MKLITTYSRSHECFYDEWFMPSLQDDYEVQSCRNDIEGGGSFMSSDWTESVLFKAHTIIDAIQNNWGELLVYSDVDVCFFSSTKQRILHAMHNRDIVLQVDDPAGNYCTGFFALRANEQTLSLWQRVAQAIPLQRRDQLAFNIIIRQMPELRCGYLSREFFGTGTFLAELWQPGIPFYIPWQPVMYHANWIIGIDSKLKALQQADRIIRRGMPGILINNYRYYKIRRLRPYLADKAVDFMQK